MDEIICPHCGKAIRPTGRQEQELYLRNGSKPLGLMCPGCSKWLDVLAHHEVSYTVTPGNGKV